MRIFVLLLVSAFTRRWETFPPVSCHTICCVDTHLHVDVAVEVNTWTALHFSLTLRTQIDFNHFKSIAESVILVLIFTYKLSYLISLVIYRNSIYSVVADILITSSWTRRWEELGRRINLISSIKTSHLSLPDSFLQPTTGIISSIIFYLQSRFATCWLSFVLGRLLIFSFILVSINSLYVSGYS